MAKLYEVRSIARSGGKLHAWGASESRAEAELLLKRKSQGENKEWADKYHERWWIEEIETRGLFVIPGRPTPRERYATRATTIKSREGTWDTLRVEVLDEERKIVARYDRNYPSLYRTFEPFRQGDRMFALISTDYTASAVLDLSSGAVVAAEKPDAHGFCPVGFYVPDWWDIHDGSILPGSTHWDADDELPRGDFGFVWGCIWGDDSSWKVQYLDLSQIQQGVLLREERFGYVELATHEKLDARDFIQCTFEDGACSVTFSALRTFDLEGGDEK